MEKNYSEHFESVKGYLSGESESFAVSQSISVLQDRLEELKGSSPLFSDIGLSEDLRTLSGAGLAGVC